jgi:hypothetical protein
VSLGLTESLDWISKERSGWSKDGKSACACTIWAMFTFREDAPNEVEVLIFFMNLDGR